MSIPLKVFAVALAVSFGSAHAAGAVELATHRAAYAVSLAAARDTTNITAISGQVAYGIEKVCGGWLQAQTGTMNMHLPSGDAVPQTTHFSSWEAEDATGYRFTVKTENDSEGAILGTARVGADGAGTAIFSHPEAAEFALPKGTLFPVAHTAFLLKSAAAGKTQVESFIFEGTEVEGVKLLVAFISPLSDAAKAAFEDVGGDLSNHSGWNFRMAYFDPQSQTGVPLYEVEADLLDNGVAPRWILDYGTYAIEMLLTKLEPLTKPDC